MMSLEPKGQGHLQKLEPQQAWLVGAGAMGDTWPQPGREREEATTPIFSFLLSAEPQPGPTS